MSLVAPLFCACAHSYPHLTPPHVPFTCSVTKKYFEDVGMSGLEERPLLFTSFMASSADDTPLYTQAASYDALKKVLEDKLNEYNETNAVMELVLFQQALEHVTRIARIIDQPR